MRWSQSFIPTLRESPTEAETKSHTLLLRAGYIRQLASGVYSYLPLAQRVMLKIARIIREEFEKIGAQEFYLPALHPAEIWKQSGRWDVMGPEMFRLKDRNHRDLCLGMTHEEVFAQIAKELRSYKDLPQIWYQIQVKFRDEPRPKGGLVRTRQFTMKDSYSFDVDYEGLDASYQKHYEAYCAVFDRCGLTYTVVEAHSGAMGGAQSQEFMVQTEAGEDLIASCECGYAANLERAESLLPELRDDPPVGAEPALVLTPNQKSIEEVSKFLNVPPERLIKSLVYLVESKPVLVLLRGDHQLNEAKLSTSLKTMLFRPAHPEEVREHFGADPGSIGPVGIQNVEILADKALKGRKNLTSGANKTDYHLQGVDTDVHFQANYVDLRRVQEGEPCIRCGRPLKVSKALEVGHIFKLGTKYSESLGAGVLNKEGKQVPIVMGSYGIGLERIMVSAVEWYGDENGILWPTSIAPFDVIITPVTIQEPEQLETAERIDSELKAAGIDVLLDDRNERPGVKFKDADLIGIPLRITIGQKLKEGKVEIYHRRTKKKKEVDVAKAVTRVKGLVKRGSQIKRGESKVRSTVRT